MNTQTFEIRELAKSILNDESYLKHLRERVIKGQAPQMEVLLYHYAYGKPTENVKLSGTMTLADLLTAAMEPEG